MTDALPPIPEYEPGVYPVFGDDRYFAGKTVDGVKQPRAPWIDDSAIPADKDYDSLSYDSPVGHNWPGVQTDMETALDWVQKIPEWYLAARIPMVEERSETRLVLIDIDNCRNPETGEVHPEALEIIEEAGSYAQVSYSGTGVHIYVRSSVPEGYKISVTGHLSDWEHEEAAGGEPEVEVYPRGRFIALTGKHIHGTPTDVVEEPALVHRLYRDYGTERSPEKLGPDGEPIDRTPKHSPEELEDIETTSDPEVIYDAVSHTDFGDFRLYSTQTQGGSDRNQRKSFDPCWERSQSGTRLGHDDGQWVYRKGNIGMDSLQVVALEEGIIRDPSEYPTGDDYREAVQALRERGARIPKFVPQTPDDTSPDDLTDSILLPNLTDRVERMGWTFHENDDGELTQSEVYRRTEAEIDRAMSEDSAALLEGIMGSGKTYSAFKVSHEREEPMMYAAPRADLYEQAVEYAVSVGYDRGDVKVMPSMFRDCPSACGKHGEATQNHIKALHSLGVTPKKIHALIDLPCENGQECPYRAQMQFDPDDYPVVIGHYKHAHLPQIASGRHVFVDEEPTDAYLETISGEQLITAVNTFLSFSQSPPFDSFEDLLTGRRDPERREEGVEWFDAYAADEGWDPDELNAVRHETSHYHALTPHAVYGILTGERLDDDSPYYRANINGRNPIIFRDADTDAGYRVTINTPPANALSYARSIIGLDGTPMSLSGDSDHVDQLGRAPLWNLALNKKFRVRRVLSHAQRAEWLRDVQNVNLVPTTEAIKPYSSGEYANRDRDFALIEGAAKQYGYTPTVVSTKRVRSMYEAESDNLGVDVEAWDHYGNLRGSNQYANHRLGILLGSPHYGDEWMAERAALLGHHIEGDGKGKERDYGSDVGNALLEAMREASIAQAALRFGRDGKGAVVCIHTSAYPDWLPTSEPGQVVTTWTEAQREALGLVADGWEGTAADLAARLDVGERQCLNILSGFRDRGIVSREKDPEDGRRYVWTEEDVGETPTYGETSLPEAVVGADDVLTKSDVEELIRDISYKRSATGRMDVVDVERVRSDPPGGGGGTTEVASGD